MLPVVVREAFVGPAPRLGSVAGDDDLSRDGQGDPGGVERVLQAGAQLARDVPLLDRQGLDDEADHDVLTGEVLDSPHLGFGDDPVVPVVVLPQVVRDVPDDAVRVHGHTAEGLRDKPVFAGVVDDLMTFVGDAQLVIHNAEFDLRFLNAELGRIGRESIGLDRVVDTLALARQKHPGQPNSLDALCDRYQINRSRRVKHGALLDAEILVEIYLELTGGRQRSLSFEDESEKVSPLIAFPAPRMESRRPRPLLIEVGEAAAHADHIRSLGEAAIWMRYQVEQAERA